jgi:hypothetical protein
LLAASYKKRLIEAFKAMMTRRRETHARPAQVRPLSGDASWEEVKSYQLRTSDYLIAVDEFAEFELPLGMLLNRAELRAVWDQHKSKVEILRHISTN